MNSYELQELSSSGLGVESGGKEREKRKRTSDGDLGEAVWRCRAAHGIKIQFFVQAHQHLLNHLYQKKHAHIGCYIRLKFILQARNSK